MTRRLVIARRSFLNKLGINWMVLSDCRGEAGRKYGPICAKMFKVQQAEESFLEIKAAQSAPRRAGPLSSNDCCA